MICLNKMQSIYVYSPLGLLQSVETAVGMDVEVAVAPHGLVDTAVMQVGRVREEARGDALLDLLDIV